MKQIALLASAALAAMAIATPAHAGSANGRWQVKLLATGVLPDGKVTGIPTGTLPAGSQTFASDNVVPTVAVEYFFAPNISVETICCVTKHHVDGLGPLAGLNIVQDISIIPATVTAKLHLPLGPIKPYVGAGPALFIMVDSKPGSAISGTYSSTSLTSEAGVAVQGGVDVAIGDGGLGFSLDAKKYWVKTTARYYTGSTLGLETRHKLDPWVVSGGISYRF